MYVSLFKKIKIAQEQTLFGWVPHRRTRKIPAAEWFESVPSMITGRAAAEILRVRGREGKAERRQKEGKVQ